VSHWYYRKSSSEVPQWAQPLIQRFPITAPTIDELTDLYHEAMLAGEIVPHPSGFIKCPECGAGADQFSAWQAADHERESLFHGYKCDACNHELTAEEG
jgi:rubredoxin